MTGTCSWIRGAARAALCAAVVFVLANGSALAQGQPRNDLCANATLIPLCTDIAGSNINAGTEGQATCSASVRDVYYRFIPPVTRAYRVFLCGSSSNWDSVLSVHTSCPALTANAIACNDDFCGVRSQIDAVFLEAQTPYIIRVASGGPVGTNGSNFILKVCFAEMSTSGACCCTDTCSCTFMASAAACTCEGCKTGVWIPGGVCSPVNYCQVKGACCGAAGSCFLTTLDECLGSFIGVGAPCEPIDPCIATPQEGACCKGSTCESTAAASCTGANTQFMGVGTVCNAAGNNTAPCCKADYNQSGGVTVQDLFDFLAAYFGGSLLVDINGSGTVSVQDLFDFLTAYFEGCP